MYSTHPVKRREGHARIDIWTSSFNANIARACVEKSTPDTGGFRKLVFLLLEKVGKVLRSYPSDTSYPGVAESANLVGGVFEASTQSTRIVRRVLEIVPKLHKN